METLRREPFQWISVVLKEVRVYEIRPHRTETVNAFSVVINEED